MTSITGSAGISIRAYDHADARRPLVVTETEYQYAPLRIFDLRPGLEGKVQSITSADRRVERGLARSRPQPRDSLALCLRVGIRGWLAGVQHVRPHASGECRVVLHLPVRPRDRICGPPAWGGTSSRVPGHRRSQLRWPDHDQRCDTGVWFLKIDGFDGWNGHDWGVPNISSVQDYDHGPEGAPRPRIAAAR